MSDKVEQTRKSNDDLLIMTHDGDIYIDPNVRQIIGLLVSDRNQWALPIIPAAPMYEFRKPLQTPMKMRSMFVYRNDPPSPSHSSMVMNRVLEAVNGIAERGDWKPHKTLTQKASQWKFLCAVVSTIAVFGMGYIGYQDQKMITQEQLKIDAARVALDSQPTGQGLPSDDEIERILSLTATPVVLDDAVEKERKKNSGIKNVVDELVP